MSLIFSSFIVHKHKVVYERDAFLQLLLKFQVQLSQALQCMKGETQSMPSICIWK